MSLDATERQLAMMGQKIGELEEEIDRLKFLVERLIDGGVSVDRRLDKLEEVKHDI